MQIFVICIKFRTTVKQ